MINISINISLSLGVVTCEWNTRDVTAVRDRDYQPQVGTITLAPGQNSTSVSLNIIDNTTPELEKKFQVVLAKPTGGGKLFSFFGSK